MKKAAAGQPQHLRILRLESENVLRLKAVHITPKGDVVQITGANDNGKTSVLNSIWLALKQTMVDAPTPLRAGAEKGRIRLDLGAGDMAEFVVERTFTPAGGSLRVETAEGGRLPKPQMVLDAMLGALTFDPLAFTRMKPREQFDALKLAVNLEVDVDKLDALNRADFERRTDVNRQARQKRAEAEGITIPPAPEAGPDEAALLDKINSAATHNANVQRMAQRRDAITTKIASMRSSADTNVATAAKLRLEAEALEANAKKWTAEALELEKTVAELKVPAVIDVSAETAKLAEARAAGRVIAARQASIERREAAIAEALKLEAAAGELTGKIEAREKEKAGAIAAAKMPVEGLGFGDGAVTYKGVPFQQASSAVQLKVSLGIAMATNPRLRVIRIQDGSLLDEASMAFLTEMAKEQDFQIWVERVDTSGKVGVFIEDGQVAALEGARQRPLV